MSIKATVAVVNKGDRIPFDGKVIDGLALVDESAHTGVSTPALLEAAEGRNNAIFDTLIVEGWLKIESLPEAPGVVPQSQPSRPEHQPTPSASAIGRPARSPLKLAFFLLLPLAAASLSALLASTMTHSAVVIVGAGIVGLLIAAGESVTSLGSR